jgi:hypothetical protein
MALFIKADFADLVEKQHALVGGLEQAGALAVSTGERAFHMTKQGGHSLVAAQVAQLISTNGPLTLR